jgi:hypothetical protein
MYELKLYMMRIVKGREKKSAHKATILKNVDPNNHP